MKIESLLNYCSNIADRGNFVVGIRDGALKAERLGDYLTPKEFWETAQNRVARYSIVGLVYSEMKFCDKELTFKPRRTVLVTDWKESKAQTTWDGLTTVTNYNKPIIERTHLQ